MGDFDHPPRLTSRCGGEDGAVLVEFALVMPILALFLFGIFEFGINMNDYQTIRQATRDSARQAVVGDYGTGSCAPPSSATPAQNSASVQCQTRAAAGMSGLAVKVVFTDITTNGASDFTSDTVKVCAVAKAKSVTGLLGPFLRSVYLKSTVEMRAEKVLALSTSAVSDADPSGANWSWCP
jgi:Flp pilus assembly protein TadG